jgi:hypothetical protein
MIKGDFGVKVEFFVTVDGNRFAFGFRSANVNGT